MVNQGLYVTQIQLNQPCRTKATSPPLLASLISHHHWGCLWIQFCRLPLKTLQFSNLRSLRNMMRVSKEDINHVMFYMLWRNHGNFMHSFTYLHHLKCLGCWHRPILVSHPKHLSECYFECRLLLASMLLQEMMQAEEVFLLHWQRLLSLLGWRKIGNSPSKYYYLALCYWVILTWVSWIKSWYCFLTELQYDVSFFELPDLSLIFLQWCCSDGKLRTTLHKW